jgi:hypothetical protein
MYEGLLAISWYAINAKISHSVSPILLFKTIYSVGTVPCMWGDWGINLMSVWRRGGHGRINGWLRVLELVAGGRDGGAMKGISLAASSKHATIELA